MTDLKKIINNIDLKYLTNNMNDNYDYYFFFVNLVISLILVKLLLSKPLLLFILLTLILHSIFYLNNDINKYSVILLTGIVLFSIDFITTHIHKYSELTIDKNNEIDTFLNSIWKIPFYSIIIYSFVYIVSIYNGVNIQNLTFEIHKKI
jgi:hypothetical protein